MRDIARCQMKSVQSGAQAAKWKAHKDKYGMQTNHIIEGFTVYEGMETCVEADMRPNTRKKGTTKKKGPALPSEKDVTGEPSLQPTIVKQEPGMFTGSAGVAANWKMGATSIVNGFGYQHPSDSVRHDTWIWSGSLLDVAPTGTLQQIRFSAFCIRFGRTKYF